MRLGVCACVRLVVVVLKRGVTRGRTHLPYIPLQTPQTHMPLTPLTPPSLPLSHTHTAIHLPTLRYEPVRYLCQDSFARAEAFKQLLLAALEQQAKEEAAPSQQPQQPQQQAEEVGQQAGGQEQGDDRLGPQEESQQQEQEQQAGGAVGEGSTGTAVPTAAAATTVAAAPNGQALQSALAGLQAHAAKRLAELATAHVQLLVDNGNSIAAPARWARPHNRTHVQLTLCVAGCSGEWRW